MDSSGRGWAAVVAVAGLVGAVGTVGCEGPVYQEERRAPTSKYLMPEPIMTTKASTETKAALGIDEWRFYRGRGGVYLSGYKMQVPVKGLATEFTRDARGNLSRMFMRVNDGSKFV